MLADNYDYPVAIFARSGAVVIVVVVVVVDDVDIAMIGLFVLMKYVAAVADIVCPHGMGCMFEFLSDDH